MKAHVVRIYNGALFALVKRLATELKQRESAIVEDALRQYFQPVLEKADPRAAAPEKKAVTMDPQPDDCHGNHHVAGCLHGILEVIGTSEDFPMTSRNEYLGIARAPMEPVVGKTSMRASDKSDIDGQIIERPPVADDDPLF